MLFQAPLVSNITSKIAQTDPYVPRTPEYYSSTTVQWTKAFNIIIMIILFIFIVNFLIQLLSIWRLIKFLIEKRIIRYTLYLLTVPLSMLYINDIFLMLIFFWGSPAFSMTRWSVQNDWLDPFPNNTYHCLFEELNPSSLQEYVLLRKRLNILITTS